MTIQIPTPILPGPSPAWHRHVRTIAATVGVSALIATGGFVAITTIGPDAVPPSAATGATVNPSPRTQRELRDGIAGQYGHAAAPGATLNPSPRTQRELRDGIAGQYGQAR